ncbi:hypothetical protein L9F63_018137, partial [Diploptera punctata]
MSETVGDKLYTGIKPLYNISKLFGLAPFSINSKKIVTKFIDYFIFGFWLIFNISGFYIYLPDAIYVLIFVSFDKIVILWIFQCILMFSKGILFLILNITSRRKVLPKMLMTLFNLDLELFYNSTFRTKQLVKKQIKLSILLCLIFLSMATVSYVTTFYPIDITKFSKVQVFYLFINRLNSSIIILQFISFVTILKERCKHVNQVLFLELITKDRCNSVSSSLLWYKCKIEDINNCLINRSCSNVQHFREIYIKMWDIFNSIKCYYQIHIVWKTEEYEKLVLHSAACIVIYYPVMFLFCFFWMAKLCSDIEEQVKLSVIIVQKFMLVSNIEHSTLTELERFSFQLNNIKMEFNICGIFTMNLRFLSSFLGVALTYLVILHQ